MREEIEPLEGDVLYGTDAIAKHLRWSVRQVKHRHETGALPTFKQGRTVCARRTTLARHFSAQEAAARSAGAGR